MLTSQKKPQRKWLPAVAALMLATVLPLATAVVGSGWTGSGASAAPSATASQILVAADGNHRNGYL